MAQVGREAIALIQPTAVNAPSGWKAGTAQGIPKALNNWVAAFPGKRLQFPLRLAIIPVWGSKCSRWIETGKGLPAAENHRFSTAILAGFG